MQRRFVQVDVFGTGQLTGNPLAVVIEAEGLPDATLKAFANWTNLSETTFLLPPTDPAADYRVRILTASTEYPFAGHPTLGSAHAWLEAGGIPKTPGVVIQECGAGLVPVRLAEDGTLAFAAPPRTRKGEVDPETRRQAAITLGIPETEWVACAWGVNGPTWLLVQVADAATVRGITPNLIDGYDHVGVVGFEPAGSPITYEVRGFAGGFEDPVTGSLNASLAQWLRERGTVPADYAVAQGSQLGRAGRITVHDDGTDIWIGGAVRTVIAGTADLA